MTPQGTLIESVVTAQWPPARWPCLSCALPAWWPQLMPASALAAAGPVATTAAEAAELGTAHRKPGQAIAATSHHKAF